MFSATQIFGAVLPANAEDSSPTRAPLQGSVQDTDLEPTKQSYLKPMEPIPAPVLPAPKLQGNVEQAGAIKPMQGNAEDDDAGLTPMSGKVDTSNHVLRGSANVENGALQGQDPDNEDQELMVQWDKWRNRFLWAIQSGVQEILSSSGDGNLRWDPRTNTVVRQFPLGTAAWFYCQVTADKRIVNFKFIHPSGYPNYDQAVQEAVAALAGTSILKFPARSKRLKVEQAAGIKTAESSQNEFFHFGDVEKYRVPANQ